MNFGVFCFVQTKQSRSRARRLSVWFGLAVFVEEQSRGVCPGPAGLKVCGLDWRCLWKNSPEVCVQGLLV